MKLLKQWAMACMYFSFLTSFSEKCELMNFKYDTDSLGAGQYTFLSGCSDACLLLEKKDKGVVFFCPGARVHSKIKKLVQEHKKKQSDDCFFEVRQEKGPVFGVKILFEVDPEKKFLLSRTFTSVTGQQGLLIRCIDQKLLNILHDKTPSKVLRYAYFKKH